MALRAGYYGVKRFLRDKLETIAGTYDETIKILFPRSEQAVLGAKNILGFTLEEVKELNTSATWNGNVCTFHNVDFTFIVENGYVKEVSVTGQADADTYISLKLVPHGTFAGDILSGCPSGGGGQTYAIIGQNLVTAAVWEYGNGVVITNDNETNYRIALFVHNGYNASNVVFKPMIRLATDTDSSFAPYAMTNKELTDSAADQKTAINAIITAATGAADFAAFKTAMGAITPVTRSLLLTKEDITEEVKEDVEPEKTLTKKRTTKKTEEV